MASPMAGEGAAVVEVTEEAVEAAQQAAQLHEQREDEAAPELLVATLSARELIAHLDKYRRHGTRCSGGVWICHKVVLSSARISSNTHCNDSGRRERMTSRPLGSGTTYAKDEKRARRSRGADMRVRAKGVLFGV